MSFLRQKPCYSPVAHGCRALPASVTKVLIEHHLGSHCPSQSQMLLSLPAHKGSSNSQHFPPWLPVSPWSTATMGLHTSSSCMDLRIKSPIYRHMHLGPLRTRSHLPGGRTSLHWEPSFPLSRDGAWCWEGRGTLASRNIWEALTVIKGQPSSKRKPGTWGESSLTRP